MDRPDSPDVAGACGGPPGERANCQDYAEDHGLVLLRVLAERRRWLGYRDFETEFRRAARDMAESEGDADLAKLTVSPRQWARWYAGQVKTRPHPDACRVLEHMFGYPVRQLFAPAEAAEGAGPVVRGVRADSYAPSGGVIVAQRPADVTPGTLPLMQWLDELRSLSELRLGSARERERVYDHLVEILERWAGTMDRREFLRLLSWASSYAAATPLIDAGEARRMAGAIAAPSRADAAALKHVEGVLWHAARQDDLLGPQAALHTVLSQRDLLRWFLTGCHDPLRSEALSLLSQAARLAGWLSFDSGDFAGAWRYYDEARSAAHEARNSALAAQVLCNMSHLAT